MGECLNPGLFKIKCCAPCPNALIDTGHVRELIVRVLEEGGYEERMAAGIDREGLLHHSMFHIAISGCPNSCTRPQIKDLGVQGQSAPAIGDGCSLCGECVAACPDNLIELKAAGPSIHTAECINCGRCARACPTGTITGSPGFFRVLAGGKLGRRPRLGDPLISLGDEHRLVEAVRASMDFYLRERRPGERFGSLLERKGFSLKTL